MLAMLIAGLLAGLVNTLAGGGPILTLMALTLAGVDPRIGNLTSTVALLPGQLVTGWSGWRAGGSRVAPHPLPLPLLAGAAAGGAIGAVLLVLIPARAFAVMVPWLVLFATLAYLAAPRAKVLAKDRGGSATLPRWIGGGVPLLGIYGGFYGGGNSFLLLAMLGWAAVSGKAANDTKNTLVAVINAAAAVVFIGSGSEAWKFAWALAAGNMVGCLIGLRLLDRISAQWLRAVVVAAGLGLAAVLFWQAYAR